MRAKDAQIFPHEGSALFVAVLVTMQETADYEVILEKDITVEGDIRVEAEVGVGVEVIDIIEEDTVDHRDQGARGVDREVEEEVIEDIGGEG